MNRSPAVGLIAAGLIIGFVGGALVARSRKVESPKPIPAPVQMPPPSPVVPQDPLPDPEVTTLRTRVAELEEKLAKASAAAEPAVEPFDAEALGRRITALAPKSLKAFQDPEFAAILEALKKNKSKGLRFLSDLLLNSKSQDERFLAAALLEGLQDPSAIPALAESLGRDEAGLVRRMSSHALAMIGTEASLPALRAAMGSDKDWGVRVNSAFGVAQLGQPDGARTLEEAYFSKEAAGYQAMIFGALAHVATSANAPFFRRVLNETMEIGYLVGSIGALEKMKDTESIALLSRIASDGRYDPTVREAARKAAEALAK